MTKTTEMKRILRAAGIDTKKVSITHKYCGYSEAYNVKLLTKEIDAKAVEKLLNKYESVDRDEYTGEILLGGNTYVDVYYDWTLYL